MLCKWENLPSSMQNDEVKFYYDILQQYVLPNMVNRFESINFAQW